MLPTEIDLAIEFAARHADKLRYCARLKKWMIRDRTIWREDDTRYVFCLARDLCREVATDDFRWNVRPSDRNRIASARMVAAVVSLARDDPRLATTDGPTEYECCRCGHQYWFAYVWLEDEICCKSCAEDKEAEE
jgi:hypothetical protein